MARYNEILVGRYNRAVQKHFQMKGQASLAQLDDALHMGIQFFSGAENRYLEAWQRYGAALTIGPVAASLDTFQIRNPGSSNVLAVVEKLVLASSAADTWIGSIGSQANDYTTILSTLARFDARGQVKPTSIVSNQTGGATAGQSFVNHQVPAAQSFDIIFTDIQEVTVMPGDAMGFQNLTVNLTARVYLWWRERFLEEAERT